MKGELKRGRDLGVLFRLGAIVRIIINFIGEDECIDKIVTFLICLRPIGKSIKVITNLQIFKTMNHITGIFIVGIITLGIYRLFELYARRKERIMMIEKLGNSMNQSEIENLLKFPFFTRSGNSSWALRISLLMIGIGLGAIIGFFIQHTLMGNLMTEKFDAFEDLEIIQNVRNAKETIYFSCIAVFGGIGLLIAYLIERKGIKKEKQ